MFCSASSVAGRGALTVVAAKGRNAGMKGRNPSKPVQPVIPNQETSSSSEASTSGKQQQKKKREKRLPNVKYSERTGRPIQSSGGQVSKASLKRMKEAQEQSKQTAVSYTHLTLPTICSV